MATTSRCACCGRDLEAHNYPRGSRICIICTRMTGSEISVLTRATVEREQLVFNTSAKDRVARRRLRYLEKHALTGGKRCSACHSVKPLDAFGVCNPRPDGLQSNCKGCNKTETLLRAQPGGKAIWRTVRDSLRAQAAANENN
jgi:hypothetical protein